MWAPVVMCGMLRTTVVTARRVTARRGVGATSRTQPDPSFPRRRGRGGSNCRNARLQPEGSEAVHREKSRLFRGSTIPLEAKCGSAHRVNDRTGSYPRKPLPLYAGSIRVLYRAGLCGTERIGPC